MKILKLIADNLAPLTLIGAIAAYLLPEAFLVFKHVFLWLFAATMFSLGVVLDPEELKQVRYQPKQIGLGLLTQYSVMPLLGAIAAYTSGLPNEIALGLIIVACAPGAMASNVVVYLAGGALAYSIALTTVATLMSPLLTPALVEWLGGALLPIPFWPMMKTILLIVVLPIILGMLVKRFMGEKTQIMTDIAPAIAVLSIVIICSYAVAANQERISQMGIQLFVIVAIVNLLGYLAGWHLARLYGFEKKLQIALSIEIGMQNAGLGVALALKHFSAATALPGAIFAVWCILTAAGMTAYLKSRP
ncbi:MAG: bile acid:sodium symporter family protein [Gammaproteobacteria bacterium]|nr:bile acid:sodium symporter family protein [Gammaproteobacteria bacterium]